MHEAAWNGGEAMKTITFSVALSCALWGIGIYILLLLAFG